MSRFRSLLCLTTLVLATLAGSVTHAHPGHGVSAPATLVHYLGEPAHALPIAALLVAGAVALMLRRRRNGHGQRATSTSRSAAAAS